MQLTELVEYLNRYLRVTEVPDYPAALNGLQVQGSDRVRRVAVAVDGAQATIEGAIRAEADLLIVHHGLFWDGNLPLTGRRYRRFRALLEADLAVYSAHLPLDVHPEVGNNVVLAKTIGVEVEESFGEYKGWPLGVAGRLEIGRDALRERLERALGSKVVSIPGGPPEIRRVGVITGGAGEMVSAAMDAGLDAFITGEGAHHHFLDAEEGGINLYFGGHYATEVCGVRALAEHLEERFGLPWEFIDHPTGL